jgi:hypothetical protein
MLSVLAVQAACSSSNMPQLLIAASLLLHGTPKPLHQQNAAHMLCHLCASKHPQAKQAAANAPAANAPAASS